ncbi:MAG: ATPase, T2SS/T4P/T4SS family, partial [Pseudobdellovibrionaceae bacterium]
MAINPNCHMIAVVGGKGGVGKSVFAANLAFALQNEMRQPTLLIDADSKSCGDQNVITGLRPVKTISELAAFTGSLNSSNMGQALAQHQSGLFYLAAARGPEEVISANPDNLMAQVESLSKSFRFIVADLGNDLSPLQNAFVDEANVILVVTAPDVLVNNQTQRLIGELVGATIPLDMIQLVVNKASSTGLSPQAISQSLRLPILASIPLDDVTTTNAVKASMPFVFSSPSSPITAAYFDLVRKLTGGILQRLKSLVRPKNRKDVAIDPSVQSDVKLDPMVVLRLKVHSELIKAMDLKKGITETGGDPAKEKALRQKTQQTISAIVDREATALSREERSKVIKEVLDEALGLGPLEVMLADPDVSEIMVNGANRIFVEKKGKVELQLSTRFTSNLHLRNVIERIVTPLGRRIDERTPYVDARLKDGSRVNAIIEPLSIDGPSL